METTSETSIYRKEPETMVTIPLYRYTELVCHAHDLSMIREIVGKQKDDYIGGDATRLIKVLCGLPTGKE